MAMEMISLEGNRQKLDGGAMFGNVPRAMWEKWISPDADNRISLACRCLLVKDWQGRNILFETGIGAFFEPKMKARYGVIEDNHVLLENLAQHGLSEEDIHVVVLSHLHFDHAGGTLSAYSEGTSPRLLFPNARYYIGKEQWRRALKPHSRDKASFIPLLNSLLEQSGRVVLVENEGPCEGLSPLVTFRFSHGHTPGLMLAHIHLENGPIVFASDLIPGFPWVHLPVSMGYDRYPELIIDEKQTFLQDWLAQNATIFFTHDPVHAFGKIRKDDKGRFYAESVEDMPLRMTTATPLAPAAR